MLPPNLVGRSMVRDVFSRKIMCLQMSIIGLNFMVRSGQKA